MNWIELNLIELLLFAETAQNNFIVENSCLAIRAHVPSMQAAYFD
jgi:hypothetical protein